MCCRRNLPSLRVLCFFVDTKWVPELSDLLTFLPLEVHTFQMFLDLFSLACKGVRSFLKREVRILKPGLYAAILFIGPPRQPRKLRKCWKSWWVEWGEGGLRDTRGRKHPNMKEKEAPRSNRQEIGLIDHQPKKKLLPKGGRTHRTPPPPPSDGPGFPHILIIGGWMRIVRTGAGLRTLWSVRKKAFQVFCPFPKCLVLLP